MFSQRCHNNSLQFSLNMLDVSLKSSPWRRIIHQKSAPEIRWISLWWTRVFGWFGHNKKWKFDLGMWIYINWNPQEVSTQRLKIIQILCSGHTSIVKPLENRSTPTAASIIMITVDYLATPVCLILILPIVELLHVFQIQWVKQIRRIKFITPSPIIFLS